MLRLTEKGKKNLVEQLYDNLKDCALPLTASMVSAWIDSLSDEGDFMHLEVRGFDSKSGNPVVLRFSGDEVEPDK